MGKVVSFPIRSQKKALCRLHAPGEEPTEGNPTVAGDSWLVMKMTNIWTIRIIIMSLHSTHICNYDSDIIPYLHAKIGSAFIRVDESHFEKYQRI